MTHAMHTSSFNAANRLAVVTGHSHGLGRAVALTLLAQGWPVLGLSRGGWAQDALAAHPGLKQVSVDLSDSAALASWLAGPEWTTASAGAERIWLVNNAGTVQPMGPVGMQGHLAVARAVALNVAAPLMLSDALLAATAGTSVERRIVHVSSGAARNPYAGWSVYCATKAALDMHARATQQDAVVGLRIESLAPGVVDTDMQAQIRRTGVDRFPQVARFHAMHADGLLTPSNAVAERLVAHLGSAEFGQQPVRDLRDLPG